MGVGGGGGDGGGGNLDNKGRKNEPRAGTTFLNRPSSRVFEEIVQPVLCMLREESWPPGVCSLFGE